MDPAVVWTLVVVLGVLLLAALALAALAATADFVFHGIRVRGGDLRGAVAAALAKMVVGDADAVRLPLVLSLSKRGLLGAATPLLGGATVVGLEWAIRVEDEHVSTVTDAHPVHIGTFARTVELPVDAALHPPRGWIRSYARYRKDRRRGAEVSVSVDGVVEVRVLGMRRKVPVHVAQYLVLGEARPSLDDMAWRTTGQGEADLVVRLANPYRGEELEGPLELMVRQVRRLRTDVALARVVVPVRLSPSGSWDGRFAFRLAVVGPAGSASADEVRIRVVASWDGTRLRLRDGPDDEDAADDGPDDDKPEATAIKPSVIMTAPGSATSLRAELMDTRPNA